MGRSALTSLMVLASLGWGCRHQFPISSGDGPASPDWSTELDGRQSPDRLTPTPEGPRPDRASLKPDWPLKPDLPPGPLVSWTKVASATSTATAKCQAGTLAGGGGSCSGALGSLGPGDPDAYAAQCGPGTSIAEAYAACISVATKITQVTVPTATALCGSGTTLVGGGCSCSAGGKLVASFPDPKTKSWVCNCGAATGLSHALCAVVPPGVKLLLYEGAACLGPEIVLGGGCACPGAAGITQSLPESLPWPLVWKCACDGGVPVTYVICAV